jgi:erythromycin esterase-like protein
MWANEEVAVFCRWLRSYNADLAAREQVGFHGLDVYSLWESLRAILMHLREHDPDAVPAALDAYLCFEPHLERAHAHTRPLVPAGCEDEVVALLTQAREHAVKRGPVEFATWQNAEVVASAERYYRAMMRGGGQSWNIRDTHMADTLDRLLDHYGPDAKAVVWAHNSHIGDARATDMAHVGMVNVGQLARERYGDQVILVGFGCYRGTVVAAAEWGEQAQVMTVPAARPDSVEAALHDQVVDNALLVFPLAAQPRLLTDILDHRAIGVVYDPKREHRGNYVPTRLADRYDAFCWFNETTALHPLHTIRVATDELETFPTGV